MKKKYLIQTAKPFLLSLFTLLSIPILVNGSSGITHSYKLSMSGERAERVVVEARMPLKEGKIEMAEWGYATSLKDGWTHFIEDLKVSGPDGPLAISKAGAAGWKVDAPDGTPLRLSYAVRLDHADHNWDSGGGMDARPGLVNGAWFMVTKALFIISYEENAAARVSFDLPEDWQISTSWKGESDGSYQTTDLFDLMDNALVVGPHEQRNIRIEGMQVVLAADHKMAPDVPMIEDALRKQLGSYRNVFDRLPDVAYLVAMRRDTVTDGEAFNNSFNLMISEDRLQDHKIVWANTVGHELFHYWTNGLHGNDHKNFEWFSEGFTEYYASLTLARTGIVPYELWHRKLERYFSRFFIMRNMVGDRASLVEAGRDKIRNWLLVYGGGASIAFAMDVTIRKNTNGERSLDDFMRRMVGEYNNKPFSLDDMEQLASEVAGKNMKPFFDAYVRGKELPPLGDIAREIGLEPSQFADEYYLAENPLASAEQKRMYDSLLRRSR